MQEWLIYTIIIVVVVIIAVIIYLYHRANSGKPANNGATCTSSSDCSSGLVCEGGICIQPASGGQVGDQCSTVKPCASGLYCSAANKCYGGDPPVIGQTCKNSTDCLNTQFCSGLNNCQAVPSTGLGNTCKLSNQCLQGNYCNSSNVCTVGHGLSRTLNQITIVLGTTFPIKLTVENNIVQWKQISDLTPVWCYDNTVFLLRYREAANNVLFTRIDSDGSIRTTSSQSNASIIYIEIQEPGLYFLRDEFGNYAKSANTAGSIIYFDGPQYASPTGLQLTIIQLVGDGQPTC